MSKLEIYGGAEAWVWMKESRSQGEMELISRHRHIECLGTAIPLLSLQVVIPFISLLYNYTVMVAQDS